MQCYNYLLNPKTLDDYVEVATPIKKDLDNAGEAAVNGQYLTVAVTVVAAAVVAATTKSPTLTAESAGGTAAAVSTVLEYGVSTLTALGVVQGGSKVGADLIQNGQPTTKTLDAVGDIIGAGIRGKAASMATGAVCDATAVTRYVSPQSIKNSQKLMEITFGL